MNTDTLSAYACPSCGNMLSQSDQRVTCTACTSTWPVEDGMPHFIVDDLSTTVNRDPDVESFFSLAGTLHWRDALARVYKDTKPMRYERIVYDKGADWMALLPLDTTARVLDAGCGWGTITFQLAKSCAEVHAIDASVNAVRFVQLRARQDSVKNVYPVRGDILHLPFADNSFDLVVLNGVLEWAGTADTSRNPARVQAQLLSEVHRVLKPQGTVYVGIENRYAATYFLGQDEGHVKLKFISLMPRPVAALYHRLRTGTPYAVYTHSLKAYRSLFQAAGFHSVQAYAPLPQYQKFSHMIPLEHTGAMQFYVTTMFAHRKLSARLFRRIVALFGLYQLIPLFAPCFSFIVCKHTTAYNGISAGRNTCDTDAATTSAAQALSYLLCSGHNAILLFAFEPGAAAPARVIKVSRQSAGETQASAPRQPAAIHPHNGIPRLLSSGRWGHHAVTVETAAPGRQLDVLIHEHRTDLKTLRRYLSLTTDWLFSFQDATRTDAMPMDTTEITRLLEPLLAAGESHLTDRRDRHHLAARLHAFSATTLGQRLPRVTQHRDFCPSNILFDGTMLSVVDWELARLNGDPLYDLFMFLSRFCFTAFADTQTYAYCDQTTVAQYAESFFFDPAAPLYHDVSFLISGRCRLLGIHPDTAKLLFLSQEVVKNRNMNILPVFVSRESCFVAGRTL